MSENGRWASPDQVLEQAQNWQIDWIVCRINQHGDWQPVTAKVYSEWKYIRTVERCGRCETERVTELTLTGRIIARWIDRYPPGFLSTHGRIIGDARDALRLVMLQKVYGLDRSRSKQDDARPRSAKTRHELGMEE